MTPMLRRALEVLVAQSIATWGEIGDSYGRLHDTRIYEVANRVHDIEAALAA
jgi:hypothetical protein